ncbi:hypothetical protein [Microbulbifer sp. GL-2]|uniref:hypothetical protein n=1 Tax=Microbulbifer sp. GL-2 TaxID=2591606 RepID=UPI0011634062|nr:hypothetical protein [Microbulbifer sp. GL-2]BBM03299.1 hypothetical protein GL2_33730 [Microbulbifer sp. GL-2]
MIIFKPIQIKAYKTKLIRYNKTSKNKELPFRGSPIKNNKVQKNHSSDEIDNPK